MELQTIFNIIGLIGSGTLGWFAKELWNAVKELKNDLALLREEIPKEYVRKDMLKELKEDFTSSTTEIKHMLIRIDTKLDHKVDKV